MEHKKGRKIPVVISVSVFVFLILVTIVAWVTAHVSSERSVSTSFDRDANKLVELSSQRIAETQIVLAAYDGLFRGSEQVEAAEFSTVFKTLRGSKTIDGLRYITYAELSDSTLPVVYAEPREEVQIFVGTDLLGEPARADAVARARDSGQAQLAAPVILNTPDQARGFVVMVPVYRNGAAQTTTAERQAAFVGVVSAGFAAQEFFQSVLDYSGTSMVALQVTLADAPSEPVFNSAAALPDQQVPGDRGLQHTDVIDFGGTPLSFQLFALPGFGTNVRARWAEYTILGAGLVISLSLAILMHSLATSSQRAHTLAERITYDLQKSKRRFQELLESSPDPVIIVDRYGRIVSINRSAEQASGFRRNELEGQLFTKVGAIMPGSLPRTIKNFALSIRGKVHPPYDIVVRIRDGTLHTYEVNARPITEDEKVIGVQVVMRDVTHRKRTEEDLMRKTQELERINKFMIGRELKMNELKAQLKSLKQSRGQSEQ